MSNTKHIAELIRLFEKFEHNTQQADVSSFIAWAARERQVGTAIKIGAADLHANEKVEETDVSISILLSMLNKYAKAYSKTAMTGLPLSTPEEFGYMARLSSFHEMPKTELATSGMEGKTTGMEMVNRLMANGLIKEKINPGDKRSKLVHLTPKGRTILAECYIRMGKVAKFVSADLTKTEKQTLKKILLKLEAYHKMNEAEIEVALLKNI